MKHIFTFSIQSCIRVVAVLTILFGTIQYTQAQCPVPYPKGDIDSTLRNVPVATVVTRNDITSFGSGVPIANDSLSILTLPQHGTVVILNDSTIIYTPAPGFVGTDFYIYTLCNSCGNCAQSSVTIEVKAYCPAPMATDDYYNMYNNRSNPSLNITANDINIAGGKLTVTLLTLPLHGTALLLSGTSIDKVSYTPTAGYIGVDSFEYLVCDTCPGAKCDTAMVYLNMLTCLTPVANNDTFTVQQLSAIAGDIAINDLHVAGFGASTFTLLSAPHFGSTFSLSGSTITYTAGSMGFGKDSIAYQLCNDCGCDTAYVIINVSQKPCAIPNAIDDNVYVGKAVSCTNVLNVVSNDTLPINGVTTTVNIIQAPLYGSAVLAGTTILYTCTDTTRVGQTDTLSYSLCNACFCDTAMVFIHITNYTCNGLPPVIANDVVHVCRNYSVAINATANDYDPDGGLVSLSAVTSQPANGQTSISGNSINYTPDTNFTGHNVIRYLACDNGTPSLCDTATIDVYVDACNHPPVILNNANNPTDTLHVYVLEDSSLQYCFKYIQQDSPYVYISHISACLDTIIPTAGSTSLGSSPCITIVPPMGSRAQQTTQVIICNRYPLCDTVDVIISILPRNHAPIARNDSSIYGWNGCLTYNVMKNDTDIDMGDTIRVTAHDATTAHGMVDSNLCYTPNASFTGYDTVHYTICDRSGACSSAIWVIYVPIKARNDQAITLQDQPVNITVKANDTWATNEFVTLCSTPAHGTATVSDSGTVAYTPAHDYPFNPLNNDTIGIGQDSFCYTLCKVVGTDTSCSSAIVYVSITPKGKFYIPQGISPNGDGLNDKFVITSADEFPKSQLLVFNRWGDEVWRNEGDGYLNDFDGTWKNNGQPLPDGSYWYIFKFNDSIHEDKMGYIIIQR